MGRFGAPFFSDLSVPQPYRGSHRALSARAAGIAFAASAPDFACSSMWFREDLKQQLVAVIAADELGFVHS